MATRNLRPLALLILGLLIALILAALAVPAWLAHQHYDDHLEKMARQLKGYAALNQSRPLLQQSLETLKARNPQKLYLKGTTPALMSAELQDMAKSIIESSGGRILSVQNLPNKEDNGHKQVGATLQTSISTPNLRRALYALETNTPYLFVENITVRSQVGPGFKPPPGFEQELFVQLDVIGFSASASAATAEAPADTKRPAGAKT
ncbi:MAG: hypothetical protein JNM52_00495 [Betaproteobacteria bacterium]|nr:hypothetical protein [Betaproteobacteria bacterium]